MFEAEKLKNEIVYWIRDWFEKNGNDCNAVVGISGGLDSSVVAALCVEALGKDRVIGVMMPNGVQTDIDASYQLVNELDIGNYIVNIQSVLDELYSKLKMQLDISEQTKINLPARIRMANLYAVSQSVNGRVANTCNLSEDWIGYSTRYGDSVGDFSPLSNLTKTEVKQIAKELGLSENLVEKVPADGLCGKTDEENFGFTYAVLDQYIRTGKIEDMQVKEKIDTLHEKNLFKLKMMDSFSY